MTNEIKHIRELSEKALMVEHPSINVTDNIMTQINIAGSQSNDSLFIYIASGCVAVTALALWAGINFALNAMSNFNLAIAENLFSIT